MSSLPFDDRCQHVLQKLRARRTGPAFVKFGRLIRYAREDLASYLSERRTEAKP